MAMQPEPNSPVRGPFFSPAQARPGSVTYEPGLAQPGGAGRAWASPQARGPPRVRPAQNGRPDAPNGSPNPALAQPTNPSPSYKTIAPLPQTLTGKP